MRCGHIVVALSILATADRPSGGQAITLPARERLHLYLLIGQSNMAGRGVVEDQDRTPHQRVVMFTEAKAWAPAVDPIHFDKPIAGVGLGSTFGRVMADANPNVTIGLIPSAVGGTPLERWQRGGDLYRQAVIRAKAAMQDGTLKGILWHQGESETGNEQLARSYGARLAQMVGDLRTELGAGEVPFVAGQLGEFLKHQSKEGQPVFWPLVNAQIAALPAHVPLSAVVSSSGLTHKGDEVHFDSASLRELGRRYAQALIELTKKAGVLATNAAVAPAPTPRACSLLRGRRPDGQTLLDGKTIRAL